MEIWRKQYLFNQRSYWINISRSLGAESISNLGQERSNRITLNRPKRGANDVTMIISNVQYLITDPGFRIPDLSYLFVSWIGIDRITKTMDGLRTGLFPHFMKQNLRLDACTKRDQCTFRCTSSHLQWSLDGKRALRRSYKTRTLPRQRPLFL